RMIEGESAPIVMFGEEININPLDALGGPDCGSVGAGRVENPVGGGAGVGRTHSLALYECKAPRCEEKEKLEKGVEGRLRITFQNNSSATKEPAFCGWSDALEESTVGGVSSIREKIGASFVTYKTRSPPGMVRETKECIVVSTGQVVAEAIQEGEL